MTSSVPLTDTSAAFDGGPGLQAVLLDMDGTLIDTEDFWWEAEAGVFAELGYELAPEHREEVVGGPMSRVADYLLRVTGASITVPELSALLNNRFIELIEEGVPLMPGAKRLLTELAAHDVPTALVSASHRQIIDLVLESIGSEHFAFSVAGDEVARTKPHPEPYLTAATRLGAAPECCVVVEDTPTGVVSAEAAGCRVVAVPSIAPIDRVDGRVIVPSLKEIDLAFLRSVVRSTH